MNYFSGKNYVWLLFSLIALFSCDTRQNIDREAIKREIKNREIIRLTDNQIQMEAERVGSMAAKDSSDIRTAFLDTYQISSDTIYWQDEVRDSTFRAIKEVFLYARESGIEPTQGIQASNEQEFFYCIPLTGENGIEGVAILTIPRKELVLNYEED